MILRIHGPEPVSIDEGIIFWKTWAEARGYVGLAKTVSVHVPPH